MYIFRLIEQAQYRKKKRNWNEKEWQFQFFLFALFAHAQRDNVINKIGDGFFV